MRFTTDATGLQVSWASSTVKDRQVISLKIVMLCQNVIFFINASVITDKVCLLVISGGWRGMPGE